MSAEPAIARERRAGPSERRASRRRMVDDLPALAARLVAGPDVTLIDVSRGGARFESENRLLPGMNVGLRLLQGDRIFLASARVVRSRVARMESGKLKYESAVAFDKECPFVSDDPLPPVPNAVVAEPILADTLVEIEVELDAVDDNPPPVTGSPLRLVTISALVPQATPAVRRLLVANRW